MSSDSPDRLDRPDGTDGSETTGRHPAYDDLAETLRTVACCDQRVGVGELGLIDEVTVDDDGVARIEILPCCTYGMARLEHEVEREARAVPGVTSVDVDVDWDECWDPERMAKSVDDATPDIEALAAEHGLEPRWPEYESEDGVER